MTPSENTRTWEDEKRMAGWKLVRVWLPPEAIKRLDALAALKGGRGKAIEELCYSSVQEKKGKDMKTIYDVAGQPVQFDEVAAAARVVEFLDDRFPARQGVHNRADIRRGIKAMERQARGVEVGALEREFC